jgi:hypothetical protein
MLCTQKTALSLKFWADFNNSPTILTRIVSRFRISLQNQNHTSAVWLASYLTKNLLLFDLFSSDFNDSHVNLTKIVSQSHTCFRNKNRTSVARTATVFVGVIEFPRHTAVTRSLCLKGQCWDFLLLVLFMNHFPYTPETSIRTVSSYPKICGDIGKSRCTTGIIDTSNKFATIILRVFWEPIHEKRDTVPLNMIKQI